MSAAEDHKGAGGGRSNRTTTGGLELAFHRGWRAGIVITLCTGLFHLINLIDVGRYGFGPALVTPFRAAFVISWLFLAGGIAASRRLPRLDAVDWFVGAATALFLLRGAFTPETFGISLNLAITGAGIYFLIKLGTRDARDLRLVIITITSAIIIIGLAGLAEYAVKENPLFDAVNIDVVGSDSRIAASSQFYRIRSLVGHPGFLGAILVAGAPLAMLSFWRRRLLLFVCMVVLGGGLFFTFSRGSWALAVLFLIPVLAYRARFWIRRNFRWLVPLILLPAIIITVDYFHREEVGARLGKNQSDDGLAWVLGRDGPYQITSGEADGVMPSNMFLYFDVNDNFYHGGRDAVTVIIHYFDRGTGAIHLDYDSWDENATNGIYTASAYINKIDTHLWTTAAFYLKNPRFEGRQNDGADFRIADDDSLSIFDHIVVQKGKLKIPTVITQQWLSRPDSFTVRAGHYPLTLSSLKEHPLGVGLFNTPGSNHHAIDSLPLTWLIELGWTALPLLGLILFGMAWEAWQAFRARSGPAVVVLVSLLLLLFHGGHLMIIYDKPSLVLLGSLGAVYSLIRPWRKGGSRINTTGADYVV